MRSSKTCLLGPLLAGCGSGFSVGIHHYHFTTGDPPLNGVPGTSTR